MNRDRAFFEALADMPIIAYEHDCKGCGECCSQFLPLTIAEKVILHGYAKKNGIKATYQPIMCPFFDMQTRLCKVYEVRPLICKQYDCKAIASGTLKPMSAAQVKQRRVVDMAKEFC